MLSVVSDTVINQHYYCGDAPCGAKGSPLRGWWKSGRRDSVKNFVIVLIILTAVGGAIQAQELRERARQMEVKGDAAGARALLQQSASATPADPAALRASSHFLDRHRAPDAPRVC